jgi:predicted Zn-dependent peptidase
VDAQDELNVRWHGPSGVHPDSPALDLLMNVLGGRSGRLYRPLVEEKKLALEVEAWYWSLRYGGVIHLGVTPREGADPAEVEKALDGIVRGVQENGVADRELQKAKNQQMADLVRTFKTNAGIAQQLGYFETIGTQRDFFSYMKALEAASPADLQRVARHYLKPQGRNVLVLRRKAKK